MGRPVHSLIGQRFGKLTVLRLSDRVTPDRKPIWFVKCDCGVEKEVIGGNLRSGQTKSCGCERTARAGFDGIYRGNAFKDLTGCAFGRWTVLGYVGKIRGNSRWVCECTCGTVREVPGNNLRRGLSNSCGCYHREKASQAAFKHGLIREPLYIIWTSMKSRCYNPAHKSWRWYGGKGICVDPKWRDDFQCFYDDMASTWQPGLSLDRINSSKDYGPENCRWVTPRQQWEEAYESRYGFKFGTGEKLTTFKETNVISEDIFAEKKGD